VIAVVVEIRVCIEERLVSILVKRGRVESKVRKERDGIERSCMDNRGGTLVVFECEGGIKLKIQKSTRNLTLPQFSNPPRETSG
jgi:hypothetical protein